MPLKMLKKDSKRALLDQTPSAEGLLQRTDDPIPH